MVAAVGFNFALEVRCSSQARKRLFRLHRVNRNRNTGALGIGTNSRIFRV